ELMYAENFFIAILDQETRILSFPYYVDEHGDQPPVPQPLQNFRGGTSYVLRTGNAQHSPRAVAEDLMHRGEVELVGAMSEDWVGVPLKLGDKTLGALVIQTYSPETVY